MRVEAFAVPSTGTCQAAAIVQDLVWCNALGVNSGEGANAQADCDITDPSWHCAVDNNPCSASISSTCPDDGPPQGQTALLRCSDGGIVAGTFGNESCVYQASGTSSGPSTIVTIPGVYTASCSCETNLRYDEYPYLWYCYCKATLDPPADTCDNVPTNDARSRGRRCDLPQSGGRCDTLVP